MARRRHKTLFDAAFYGDLDGFCRLLLVEPSPPDPNDLVMAFDLAVSFGQLEYVEILVRLGVDPNQPSNVGSLLHRAASGTPVPKMLEIVRLLGTHGADLHARDHQGTTPLLTAVRQAAHAHAPFLALVKAERFAMIDTLLALGARLDDRNDYGETAAMIAVLEEDEELLHALLERGASDAGIATARLYIAAEHGRAGEVAALLARGTNPNWRCSWRPSTPLCNAAWRGHLEVVDLLLAAGADVDMSAAGRPDGDFSPLHNALSAGHLEIVRRLLAAGANPRLKGPGGYQLVTCARDGVRYYPDDPIRVEILTLMRDTLKRTRPSRISAKKSLKRQPISASAVD
ncbi:MAG: hypothetical protein HC897_16475 [Thermoanaerobaculia bacterium]|nr:hypothetical protein [Thermoanaerobaculia bacterium]